MNVSPEELIDQGKYAAATKCVGKMGTAVVVVQAPVVARFANPSLVDAPAANGFP